MSFFCNYVSLFFCAGNWKMFQITLDVPVMYDTVIRSADDDKNRGKIKLSYCKRCKRVEIIFRGWKAHGFLKSGFRKANLLLLDVLSFLTFHTAILFCNLQLSGVAHDHSFAIIIVFLFTVSWPLFFYFHWTSEHTVNKSQTVSMKIKQIKLA